MSRRQLIGRKLDRYADVRAMLSAMKNIAMMEVKKLGAGLDRQARVLDTVARAAADFSTFYELPIGQDKGICIVIGSERGFCGEFNSELLPYLAQARDRGDVLLAVGSRLADRVREQEEVEDLPGAVVAEEIPVVLERVAAWLEQAQTGLSGQVITIRVLYQDEQAGHPLFKTIAPLPVPDKEAEHHPSKPMLTLEPSAFLAALGEQSLLLSLEGLFMLSLTCENRRRLEHMDHALHRLDESTIHLRQEMNMARQDEIIQEIETIMLGSGM